MRWLLALMLPLVCASASPRDVLIRSADIEKVQVTISTVIISFSSVSHGDVLAEDREFSMSISFPFPGAKSMSISQVHYVAHRLASISFTLDTPDDAEQFAQGVRDGRVHLATHPKT